jgi:hypothetical protein
MSEDVWISAFDALSRVKGAGGTEDDLLEWARIGRLRARAKSGIDSDDVTPPKLWLECVRTFPAEPLVVDGITISTWPDIPKSFWADTPAKALWVAGTFANKLHYFCDYHQELTYAYFELFDVTFNAGDLGALLPEPEPEPEPELELEPVVEAIRGVLPSNATPGERRYEEAAHHAAEIMRSKKVILAAALREALEETKAVPEGVWDTRQRQLRTVYRRIYNAEGWPIQMYPD